MTKGMAAVALACVALGAGGHGALGGEGSARATDPTAAVAALATLGDLVEELDRCAGCPAVAYFWSPSMPLSRLALPEARAAARSLGLRFVPAPARVLDAPSGPEEHALRASLVRAGATLHHPSLVLFDSGEPRGPALVGYKRSSAYRGLLAERTRGLAARDGAPPPMGPDSDPISLQDAEILWTRTVSPPPGAFFRRVPGTSWISYDQSPAVHLHDLATDESFRGPGWIDFVPTPRGRMFVTPGPGDRGLEFYLARDVFERGRTGDARDVAPVLVDPELADQYPSVGILESDGEGRPSRYRVLVSWFRGLAFRDYAVRWQADGSADLRPATPRLTGCPGRDLSTPILSKSGREVAARDEDTGTTKVFRMADDGACAEILDLGRGTSKVGFSDDGRLIAYSAPDPAWAGRGVRSVSYVLDRSTMRTRVVPHSRSAGLVIPEMAGTDSVLVAVREDGRSGMAEFRLIRLPASEGGAPRPGSPPG